MDRDAAPLVFQQVESGSEVSISRLQHRGRLDGGLVCGGSRADPACRAVRRLVEGRSGMDGGGTVAFALDGRFPVCLVRTFPPVSGTGGPALYVAAFGLDENIHPCGPLVRLGKARPGKLFVIGSDGTLSALQDRFLVAFAGGNLAFPVAGQ